MHWRSSGARAVVLAVMYKETCANRQLAALFSMFAVQLLRCCDCELQCTSRSGWVA